MTDELIEIVQYGVSFFSFLHQKSKFWQIIKDLRININVHLLQNEMVEPDLSKRERANMKLLLNEEISNKFQQCHKMQLTWIHFKIPKNEMDPKESFYEIKMLL